MSFGHGIGLGIVGARGAVSFTPYSPLSLCLDLNNDTVNERVTWGHSADFDFGKNDPFSIGIWLKFAGGVNTNLFTKRNYPNAGWQSLVGSAGNLTFNILASGSDYMSITNNAGLGDSAWHSVIMTYGGGNLRTNMNFYKDGSALSRTLSGSASLTGDCANVGHMQVGCIYNWTAQYFVGKVCHPFVAAKELTPDECLLIGGQGAPRDLSSLGALYRFGCTMGDGCAIGALNMLDVSGYGNHGTCVNVEAGDFVADVPP